MCLFCGGHVVSPISTRLLLLKLYLFFRLEFQKKYDFSDYLNSSGIKKKYLININKMWTSIHDVTDLKPIPVKKYDFDKLEVIGGGNNGTVYSLDKHHVIKVFFATSGNYQLSRATEEAQLLKLCSDNDIGPKVPTKFFFTCKGDRSEWVYFVMMERFDDDASAFIFKNDKEYSDFGQQIRMRMYRLCHIGIICKDAKPENILVKRIQDNQTKQTKIKAVLCDLDATFCCRLNNGTNDDELQLAPCESQSCDIIVGILLTQIHASMNSNNNILQQEENKTRKLFENHFLSQPVYDEHDRIAIDPFEDLSVLSSQELIKINDSPFENLSPRRNSFEDSRTNQLLQEANKEMDVNAAINDVKQTFSYNVLAGFDHIGPRHLNSFEFTEKNQLYQHDGKIYVWMNEQMENSIKGGKHSGDTKVYRLREISSEKYSELLNMGSCGYEDEIGRPICIKDELGYRGCNL